MAAWKADRHRVLIELGDIGAVTAIERFLRIMGAPSHCVDARVVERDDEARCTRELRVISGQHWFDRAYARQLGGDALVHRVGRDQRALRLDRELLGIAVGARRAPRVRRKLGGVATINGNARTKRSADGMTPPFCYTWMAQPSIRSIAAEWARPSPSDAV